MKKIIIVLVSIILLLSAASSFSFVGGARGGFSGGSHGGASFHSMSHSYGGGGAIGFLSFIKIIIEMFIMFVVCLFLIVGLSMLLTSDRFSNTPRAIRGKRKRFIKKNRYVEEEPRKRYPPHQLAQALFFLKRQAIEDMIEADFYPVRTQQQLKRQAKQLFLKLQHYWVMRDQVGANGLCLNNLHGWMVDFKIKLMKEYDVYNLIDDTVIDTFELVKFHFSKGLPIMRFVVKGVQIDEFIHTPPGSLVENKLSPRSFSCLFSVTYIDKQFKVDDIFLKPHVDDYVMDLSKDKKTKSTGGGWSYTHSESHSF